MTSTIQRTREKTYIPGPGEERELFSQLEEEMETTGSMTLCSATGKTFELPSTLFEVIRFVGANLASGHGVTVVPREIKLTTQGAADFLGISRPTLVKILERGDIPFDTVGRHRRVKLDDVLLYQEQAQARRSVLLTQMARNGQESGMVGLYSMADQAQG